MISQGLIGLFLFSHGLNKTPNHDHYTVQQPGAQGIVEQGGWEWVHLQPTILYCHSILLVPTTITFPC